MDYVVDEEQYTLETLTSYTQYLRNRPRESERESDAMQTEDVKRDMDVHMREASIKRAYTLYTDQDKVRFFNLMFEKVLSASAAAKQLGIHVRTAQRWVKQYESDPDSIFVKRKKNGCPRILGEEHKKVILEYVDEIPSAALKQSMERLRQRFEGLKVSKSIVYDSQGDSVTCRSRRPSFCLWTGTARRRFKSTLTRFAIGREPTWISGPTASSLLSLPSTLTWRAVWRGQRKDPLRWSQSAKRERRRPHLGRDLCIGPD